MLWEKGRRGAMAAVQPGAASGVPATGASWERPWLARALLMCASRCASNDVSVDADIACALRITGLVVNPALAAIASARTTAAARPRRCGARVTTVLLLGFRGTSPIGLTSQELEWLRLAAHK